MGEAKSGQPVAFVPHARSCEESASPVDSGIIHIDMQAYWGVISPHLQSHADERNQGLQYRVLVNHACHNPSIGL